MIKVLNYLSEEERFVREEVFCKEQGFINEIDDLENSSFHLLYYLEEKVIGVCRFYELEKDIYKIGRIAVLKEYRNKGLGKEIVNSAINYIKVLKAKKIYIYSQLHAVGFYEKLGFNPVGRSSGSAIRTKYSSITTSTEFFRIPQAAFGLMSGR